MDDYAREYVWYLEGCRLLGWEDPLSEAEFARLYRQWFYSRREYNKAQERIAQLRGVQRTIALALGSRRLRAVWRDLLPLNHVVTAVDTGRRGDGSTPEGVLLRPGPGPRGGTAASPLPPEPARDP